MSHPVLAIAGGAVGSLVSAGAGVLAATGDNAGELIPWAQVGGSGAAVAILGYIAKKMLDGELVARPTVELEAKLADLVERGLKREERTEELVEDSKEREADLRSLLLMHGKGQT